MVVYKKCTRCKEVLEYKAFSLKSNNSYNNNCKECLKKNTKSRMRKRTITINDPPNSKDDLIITLLEELLKKYRG